MNHSYALLSECDRKLYVSGGDLGQRDAGQVRSTACRQEVVGTPLAEIAALPLKITGPNQ